MTGDVSKQIQDRLKRNRKIARHAARRDSFRLFWRKVKLFPEGSRKMRRGMALALWRKEKNA
jgi:hypothetical protein